MLLIIYRYHLNVTLFGFNIFVSMSMSESIYVLWMWSIFHYHFHFSCNYHTISLLALFAHFIFFKSRVQTICKDQTFDYFFAHFSLVLLIKVLNVLCMEILNSLPQISKCFLPRICFTSKRYLFSPLQKRWSQLPTLHLDEALGQVRLVNTLNANVALM